MNSMPGDGSEFTTWTSDPISDAPVDSRAASDLIVTLDIGKGESVEGPIAVDENGVPSVGGHVIDDWDHILDVKPTEGSVDPRKRREKLRQDIYQGLTPESPDVSH